MSTTFNEDFIVKNGLVVTTTATFLSTVTSTSSLTGALVVAGGIGVQGEVNVGGILKVQNVDLLAYDPDTIYVSESSGNDTTGDGRRVQSAFKTIKHALTVATTGTRIVIDAGTYYEEWPLTVPAGVTITGAGIRATTLKPTTATNTQTCFFLNGEDTITDLTISGFYQPGYAFKFAQNCKITTRSPYVERVTVLTRGSITSELDPYGFDAADAGGGAYLDASVLDRTSLEPAMLWNECTFIVPNATGWYMTNGARAELLNAFTYFADKSIHTVSTPVGYGGDGKTKLRLAGINGVFTPGDTLYYKDSNGNTLANGVIESTATGGYIFIDGPAWGFEEITLRGGKSVTPYGGAIQSTDQKKFGASSYKGNGTTTYLELASSADFEFSTGTFCVEAFVYRNNTVGTQILFDFRSAVSTPAPVIFCSGTNIVYQVGSTATVINPALASPSLWYHIAVARSGTETRVFVDGTQVGSTSTDLYSLTQAGLKIGSRFDGTLNFNGFIDEIRVSKGAARYTSNFTAPTAPFVSDDDTKLLLHCDNGNLSATFTDDALGSQNIYSTGSAFTGTAARIILADYHQFGAEIRCIGSAAVFGNYGVIADGTGTNLKLIAFNLSHIGSGKDLSDDISLVVQANEIVQTNNGKIYYQTVDQNGDFRVGDGFLINQRTGSVSFGQATINIANLPNLTVTDGVNSTVINPTNIQVGNINLSQNLISTISGNLELSPANSQVVVNADMNVGGSVTATNFYGDFFGKVDNIAGGDVGFIPYQSSTDNTDFIGTGTEYSLLRMGTESTATFVSSSSVQVGFAANVLGGLPGQLVYQSTSNQTAFVNTASVGDILVSKGEAAPEFVSTTTIYVYRATVADSASGGSDTANNLVGGSTGQIPYQTTASDTSFFGPGTAGQILVSRGDNVAGPEFTNTSSIFVKDADIATNLRGGQAGQVAYQSGLDVTDFTNVGNQGDLLISGGAGAPVFTSTTTIFVGRAIVAETALSASGSAGSSDQVRTQQRTTDAAHFLMFVDTNNPAPGLAETVYTTSSFVVNPSSGFVGLGTATPGARLDVRGDLHFGPIADSGRIKSDSTNTFIDAIPGTGAVIIRTGGAVEKVRVDDFGRVGINTTVPESKLHVAGDVRISGVTTVTSLTSVHNTTTGALRVQGGLAVDGGGYFTGAITATNFIGSVSGTSDTANNLAGGTAGAIPYQTAPSVTTFLAIATPPNSILVSPNGTAPSWSNNPVIGGNLTIQGNLTVQGTTVVVDSTVTNVSDPIITIGTSAGNTPPFTDDGKDRGIAFWWHNGSNARTGFFGFDRSTEFFTFITSATIVNEVVVPGGGTTRGAIDANLAGGLAGDVVYQTAPNVTGFISTTSLYVGRALVADSASSTTGSSASADQVKTQARTTQATHFVTFVNSNNAAAGNEDVYTTSSFTIDPGTAYVGIGVTSPSVNLHVRGASGEMLRLDSFLTTTGAVDTGPRMRFDGHDGVQSRDFVLLVGAKENGTSGNGDGYFAVRTRQGSTSPAERLRVDSAGRVGINTTTPISLLDVVGNTRITGITTVTNLTSAHSTQTGALQVAGGLAVAGGGFFGGTVTATNFVGAISGSSSQVSTVERTNAALHYLTFVDSNNSSLSAENLFTSSTVAVNPGTPSAISTTTGALQIVNGGVGVGGSVYVQNRVGFVNASNVSAVYQVYNAATNSLDTVFA
jgi:hypothetical protein